MHGRFDSCSSNSAYGTKFFLVVMNLYKDKDSLFEKCL